MTLTRSVQPRRHQRVVLQDHCLLLYYRVSPRKALHGCRCLRHVPASIMACYSLIFAYLMGGVTFVPLLALLFVLHAYFLLPQPSTLPAIAHDAVKPHEKDRDLEDKLASRTHEPDVAAGYFAVCREYVPSGVNGKPPERTTPAGETITAESPSVYQSMYRTIFDRGKSQTPTMEAGKLTKKARNVFYVVLRYDPSNPTSRLI